MRQIKISDAKNGKHKRFRALIAYSFLIAACMVIILIGNQIIYLFDFELDTRIRDVDPIKAIMVFVSMLPIVLLVGWVTLTLIEKLFQKFKI